MKVMLIEIKPYQSKNTLMNLKPYLKDINNLKKFDTWQIPLTIVINLFLLKTLMKNV